MKVETTYYSIWKVAYPLILGSLANNLLNVVDTAFIGRLGNISLGASAIGSTYYLVFSLICIGLSSGAQIIIARKSGAKDYKSIGKVFVQNTYLMFLFGILLLLFLITTTPSILRLLITSDAIYHEAIAYTSYRVWGIFFVALTSVYTSFYVGITKTKVLIYSTAVMTFTNIILDYGLIFGHFMLPRMNISGGALASVIAEASAFLFIVVYTRKYVNASKFQLYKFERWSSKLVFQNIKLGYPIMFQYLMSLGSWFMFFIIIEKLGEQVLAVSNILRSLLLLFMMPIWGLSSTANSFTSNLLGQDKSNLIPLLLKRLNTIAGLLVLFFAPFVLFFPELLAQIYSDDVVLITESSKIIWIVYITMLTFIPGVILNNSLCGTGDTKTAFVIELFGTFFYLTYAYFVAIHYQLPLAFIWFSEMIYWFVIGLLSFYRLKSRKWKSITI